MLVGNSLVGNSLVGRTPRLPRTNVIVSNWYTISIGSPRNDQWSDLHAAL